MTEMLLSIVVPTKNRYYYLEKLIELFISYSLYGVELVIQDNSDNNENFLNVLEKYKACSGIKYFYQSDHLSIGENSDKAILNSTGEYVCFIGDDDGFTPYIREAVLWMKSHHENALISADVNYYWPDYHNSITGDLSSSITYIPFKKDVRYVETKKMLRQAMATGFTVREGLPLVYHGIVKRETLDKIYNLGNTFFPGPSPDMANGIALAVLLNRYVIMDLPILVAGASQHQGGGARAMKNQAAELSALPFLPKDTEKLWEDNIPKIWTAETIWAESAIKALRYMGREELIQDTNFEYLYARFIVFHFNHRSLIYKYSKHKVHLALRVMYLIFQRYYNGGTRLMKRKLFKMSDGKIIIHHITDINKAIEKLIRICSLFEIKG